MAELLGSHPIPRAYGVAWRDDTVLLVRASSQSNAEGVWWLPGGGIDWRESPTDALAREFLEETGLTVTSAELLMVASDVRTRTNGEIVHTIRIVYDVSVAHGEITNELDGTTDVAAWVTLADIGPLDLDAVRPMRVAPYALSAIAQSQRRRGTSR